MLKRALLLILCIAASLQANDTEMSAKINAQDVAKVTVLASYYREIQSPQLQRLLGEAKGKLEDARDNVKLSKSPIDAVKFGLGTSAYVIGCYLLGYTALNWRNSTYPYRNGAIAGAMITAGGYFAVNGFYCDIAVAKLEKAKKIYDIILKMTTDKAKYEREKNKKS